MRDGPRRKPKWEEGTYLPQAGKCLRRDKEWRGTGEATKGSEGMKKSELSQGGLERQDR